MIEPEVLVTSIVTLFVVVDPIGNIPIVVGLTQNMESREKKSIIKNAIVAVAGLLTVFALVGSHLLSFFGVSISSFMIAGGVLLFITAIEFLTHGEWRTGGSKLKNETGIVPLAFPLLSGPGALTVVMISYQTAGLVTTLISIAVVIGITYLVMRCTDPIYRLLGQRGAMIVTRVFAIFIAAIAVQFVINGIREVFF